jgi:hypothetical protein
MSILRKYSFNIGASLCVLLAALASPAGAATVFDNGGPNTVNGWGIQGSDSTADNFSVASNTSIGSVGFYFQNYSGITGWNQDIQYAFLTDNSGSPGTVLASGAGQNLVATDSGLPWCCGGGNAYLVTFDLVNPFNATAGTTYWLRLGGATGSNNSAWWVTSNGTASSIAGSSRPGSPEFAFYLSDDTNVSGVPEPGSLALLGLGGSVIALMRRRAMRRS